MLSKKFKKQYILQKIKKERIVKNDMVTRYTVACVRIENRKNQ